MSYTLVLEWMPGDLYMSAVTARCTAPTSSYSVVWLPPNKVYQITLYCGSTSLVSFLVGAFRGKAWSYMKTECGMRADIESVLFTEEQIQEIVQRVGGEISRDYKDKNLLLVSVLKGSVVFMADLMRAITIPARIDFMATSSYGSGVKTSGVVKIVKDLDLELKGYDILIVEDILDSGKTLSYLMELLQARGPKSIQICTLFDKPDRREVEVRPTYVGAQIPDAFIVGYGLDYDEKYRNLPFVGVLKPSVYE